MIYKVPEEVIGKPSSYLDGEEEGQQKIVELIAQLIDVDTSVLSPYFSQYGLESILKNPSLVSLPEKDMKRFKDLIELLQRLGGGLSAKSV